MKIIRKFISAALVLSLAAGAAGCAAAPDTATFHETAYAFGPGVDNLSTSDEYSRYQWGLRNEGDLEYVEIVNRFSSLSPMLATLIDFSNWLGIEIPPFFAGPDAYRMQSVRAVAGVDINVQPAWQQYDADPSPRRDVIVAVIDTGVDFSHPELAGAMWVNPGEIPGDGIDNDLNGYVDDINGWNFFDGSNVVFTSQADSHGTHAAGTIAAKRGDGGIAGIADPDHVKIMSLKVLGTEYGVGEEQAVIDAIHYAEANGASICNLSFGTEYYYPELEQTMRNSGMLFILSAGNGDDWGDGINMDISAEKVYPACFALPNTITVANLMFDGTLEESSNYGMQYVDIAAPGTYILSLSANNGYAYMSGTSMAAPMVTGVAALVYSYRPDLTLADVRNAILSTAKKLAPLTGLVTTGGVVDAYAAMNYLR